MLVAVGVAESPARRLRPQSSDAPVRCRGVTRDSLQCRWTSAALDDTAQPLREGGHFCLIHAPRRKQRQEDPSQLRLNSFFGKKRATCADFSKDSPCLSVVPFEPCEPSPCRLTLTPEQRSRIDENRQRALERKLQRQNSRASSQEELEAQSPGPNLASPPLRRQLRRHLTDEQRDRITTNRQEALDRRRRKDSTERAKSSETLTPIRDVDASLRGRSLWDALSEAPSKDAELTVVFEPGAVGKIAVEAVSGLVKHLAEDGQAYRLGVRAGMRFITVYGSPYTKDRLFAARAGTKSYEVTFAQAAPTLESAFTQPRNTDAPTDITEADVAEALDALADAPADAPADAADNTKQDCGSPLASQPSSPSRRQLSQEQLDRIARNRQAALMKRSQRQTRRSEASSATRSRTPPRRPARRSLVERVTASPLPAPWSARNLLGILGQARSGITQKPCAAA